MGQSFQSQVLPNRTNFCASRHRMICEDGWGKERGFLQGFILTAMGISPFQWQDRPLRVQQDWFSRAFDTIDLASRLAHLLQETAVLMETDCMQFSAYFVRVWKLTPKMTFLCKLIGLSFCVFLSQCIISCRTWAYYDTLAFTFWPNKGTEVEPSQIFHIFNTIL